MIQRGACEVSRDGTDSKAQKIARAQQRDNRDQVRKRGIQRDQSCQNAKGRSDAKLMWSIEAANRAFEIVP